MINCGFSMITSCRKGIRYLRYDTGHTLRERPHLFIGLAFSCRGYFTVHFTHHHMINEAAGFVKLIMVSNLHRLTGDVDL